MLLGLFMLTLVSSPAQAQISVVDVVADPAPVHLKGPNASYSLLVQGKTSSGRVVDLTSLARFQSLQPKIASVSDGGVVRSVKDGTATVVIEAAGKKVSVKVTVEGSAQP